MRLSKKTSTPKSPDEHSLTDKNLHLKYLITTRLWAMLGPKAGNLPDAVELDQAGPCPSGAACRLLRVPDREDIRRVYLERAFSEDWSRGGD